MGSRGVATTVPQHKQWLCCHQRETSSFALCSTSWYSWEGMISEPYIYHYTLYKLSVYNRLSLQRYAQRLKITLRLLRKWYTIQLTRRDSGEFQCIIYQHIMGVYVVYQEIPLDILIYPWYIKENTCTITFSSIYHGAPWLSHCYTRV